MYQRLQRKLQKIMFSMDFFEYREDVLRVKGWLFSEEYKIEDVMIVLKSGGQSWDLLADTGIERIDVFNHFKGNLHAKNSGFYATALIKGITNGSVWLEYSKNGKNYKLYLGEIKGDKEETVTIKTSSEVMEYLELGDFEENSLGSYVENTDKDVVVDIIIPVYNGFQYLDPLLGSIKKTKMKYRLILIDDASPDERIKPYLREYQACHPETILIENEINMGFVKSVNKGLRFSSNHVALVNTDVEVPDMWLERLMKPILENDTVASTTPYTNAGTICSFPNIGKDHKIFYGLPLETVDDEFKKIKPRYVEMPTGVGFCMGMSKRALDIVGVFDEESFGMGYGEENDWCQRAIKNNMVNVQVENLFVYHKHGGSFLSEDKRRYIEKNSKILSEKYPKYNREVAYFFETDINKDIRKYVEWNLLLKMGIPTTLAFNHNLGGGATAYLENKEREILSRGEAFCLIRCNLNVARMEIDYKYKDNVIKIRIQKLNEIADVLTRVSPQRIIINEFVTYPELYELLQMVVDYRKAHETELTLLGHDYYMVCPTVNLLDEEDRFCEVPSIEKCELCLQNSHEIKYLPYGSIQEWREKWGSLIHACDHVIVFSNDSKEIMEKAYGQLDSIQVIPHKIDYLPVIEKKYKTTKTLNIGLLGVLVKHKGLEIIKKTLKYIEENNLDINIVLIGKCGGNIQSNHFVETGSYTRDMLPKLAFEYDVDIFLVSSICPETFSYTAEEIMTMNFPVMCFDLGAPAERIRKYEKGYILPTMEPKDIVSTAQNWYATRQYINCEKKILFVVEDITFSSRYRVEHLREQLIYNGIASDCVSIKEALSLEFEKYESIVVYRGTNAKLVRKLVKKAHKSSKKVFYDIDDFVFEYESIAELGVLNSEYKNARAFCDNIKNVMRQCDAYITSTNALAKEIKKSMNSDKVYINRNVASAEMAVVSASEKEHAMKNPEKVILGYFSGTKTHDKDFREIKDVLLEIMKTHDNVWLKVGGQITLPKEFSACSDRIETFDFVSWKKLPKRIASVDINLMPLENTVFHECKSENKWQEAALVGVPTIASYNDELAIAITDGKDGYLCQNCDEWKKKLEDLVVNQELRDTIAEAAYEKVMGEYTTYTRNISNIEIALCGESN